MDSRVPRLRRILLIGGIICIALAIAIIFLWHPERGIWYWIGYLLFSLLTLFGLKSLKDWRYASDETILKHMGLPPEV